MKMINRRKFLQQAGLLTAGSLLSKIPYQKASAHLMTVNGPLRVQDAGCTLSHEHILVDFIGASKITPSRYNREEVFQAALPKLLSAKEAGCKTLIECTPAWLGRDVTLLKQLSGASGINLITNTGYYGAAGEKYYPDFVFTEPAEQIAGRWISEWENGIEATGIKPGFIKTGVDKFPLTATQQKVIKAAAITHLATGLPIGVHTGDGNAAMQEMSILKQQGVNLNSWIWIHAQNERDTGFHIKAAREGGWVEFDGVNAASEQSHIGLLTAIKKNRLLHKVLISQDSGWYHVGEPKGGNYKDYNYILTHFIPNLIKHGFTPKEVHTLFYKNPATAFSIRKPV